MSEFFLLSVALGMSLFSIVASTELTGNGFLKLVHNAATAALFVATIVHLMGGKPTEPQLLLHYGALFCLVMGTLFHKEKKSVGMWTLYVVQNLCLLTAVWLFAGTSWINFAYLLTSVGMLGIILYAMTLGHWYLVVPKLSVLPLKVCLWILWPVMLVKIIVSGISVWNAWDFFQNFTELGGGYAFNWLMLTMRVLWGYVVIGGMSYFTWRLVKMRSTQSATGVLYAMVIFVFIGELVSSYWLFKYGLFI